MKTFINILLLTGVMVPAAWGVATGKPDSAVLLNNYIRYQVSQSAMSQSFALTGNKDQQIQDEVRQAAANWLTGQNKKIKADLEGTLGDSASAEFQKFWVEFEAAESAGDKAYLGQLKTAAGIDAVQDYPSLRRKVLDAGLSSDVAECGALLSAIEGWLEAVDKGKLKKGTLSKWINGEISIEQKPVDPLQAMEADAEPFVVDVKAKDDNPLDTFKSQRDAKRKKALEDAKAGMAQVASERQAAESEYAAKVQAAAQAEAANLQKHADRLSASEKEAFEQRQKSFGNRLKNVVSATIGAATGAFTGGVGARAGQAAVDAIWGNTTPAYVQPIPPGGSSPQPGQ